MSYEADPMGALCKMVVDTEYEDLPSNVITYAKRSILDTIGVTIGGSALEGIPVIVNLVKEKGGKPESIIPFYGGKVPASEAGFAIGPMARAMDLGDIHPRSGHVSEYIIPTLLAATGLKNRVNGKEFITACVVGQEVSIRIGEAFAVKERGRHTGRHSGDFIFGAVAAAGKLLSLTLEELENAEGIAREMTQPHDQAMFNYTTLMVRVHTGFICQDAINACQLAQRGITGAHPQLLVGPMGYLGFAKWETDSDALTKGLGEKWEMTETGMKSYPSCNFTQSPIYGILEQMKEHNFEAEDIANIDIEMSPKDHSVYTPREKKWNPRTVGDCQFSLPYTVATAAYDKDVFLDSYTPQARDRQDVRELMKRISVKENPNLPMAMPKVSITLKSGRNYSKEYPHPKGHPKNPFTEQELIDKFKKCVPYSAYKLSDAVVASVIKALLSLEKVDDVVSAILLSLTPPLSSGNFGSIKSSTRRRS